MRPFTSSISQAPLTVSPFLTVTIYSSLLAQSDFVRRAAGYRLGPAAFALHPEMFFREDPPPLPCLLSVTPEHLVTLHPNT